MNSPADLIPFVLTINATIIAAVLVGLHRATGRTDWPQAKKTRVMRTGATLVIGWYLLALLLSIMGVFRGLSDRLPTIEFGIFIPILAGLLLLWRSETVAKLIEVTPQHWLVAVQFYRVFGVIFILLLAAGQLPPQFALPAGWGDIAVGLLAPLVALVYARGYMNARVAVLGWNVFGLLDLVIAVATGFLTSPSPFQMLAMDRPNELISAFPLVMVPVFAVPLSVLLHTASLAKLAADQDAKREHDDTFLGAV